jgi:hypothetical protein
MSTEVDTVKSNPVYHTHRSSLAWRERGVSGSPTVSEALGPSLGNMNVASMFFVRGFKLLNEYF